VRLEIKPPINPREGPNASSSCWTSSKTSARPFCQLAIDHARDVAGFIPLLHRAMPRSQERQADNMATLLAGYSGV